ncbi:MAG: TetR-like C-terminal domain-containing protein [Clostridia bacterium]|nr:TetR-like C-terminal domain-containing protein [Clostridia bacterium]
MSEKPTGKITVKEICEKAEVNRSTFYLYCQEPNNLLMELEDECIGVMTESLTNIGALVDDEINAKDLLLNFLRAVRRNDELLYALLVKNSDPHFRRKFMAVALELIERLFNLKTREEYKAMSELFIVSGSVEILTKWIESRYEISEHSMCDMLYLFCEGLLGNIVNR